MEALNHHNHHLNKLQRVALLLMSVLTVLTFVAANLHALLWQSSEWLVSTVLPAVVVDLTNEERSENHAAPLTRNTVLDAAAKLKAKHMAENEYFAHFSPDGVSPWHWFREAGYVYAHAGENLAIHFTDSAEVVEAWMDSPTHRQNIVDGKFTEIGVGTAKGEYDGYDTVYVVQLFGAPAMPAAAPVPQTDTVPPPVVTPPESIALVPVPESVVTSEALLVPTSPVASDEVAFATEEVSVVPEQREEVLAENSNTQLLEDETLPEVEVESEADEAVFATTEQPTVPAPEFIVRNHIPAAAGSTSPSDVVVIESTTIATSSGLAVADLFTPTSAHAGGTLAAYATQPNSVLEVVYMVVAVAVVLLLLASVALEIRRFHFIQVSYGVLLLIAMAGLWYTHSFLTSGAVVV